jgi:hypothetical protein
VVHNQLKQFVIFFSEQKSFNFILMFFNNQRLKNFWFSFFIYESVDFFLYQPQTPSKLKLERLLIKDSINSNLINSNYLESLHVADLDKMFLLSLELCKSKFRLINFLLPSLYLNYCIFRNFPRNRLAKNITSIFRFKIRKCFTVPHLGFFYFFDDTRLNRLLLTNLYLISRSNLTVNNFYFYTCFFYLAY